MLGRKSIGVSLGLLVILSASLVECHPHDTPGDPANPCTNNANCQQRVLATNEYPLRYHWVATCAHAATQGPTDFNCTCRTGFEEETTVAARVYDSDGDPATAAAPVPFLCKDINECTAGDPCTVHVSDYSCSNTFGSFTCSCNEGYAPDATGACVDINECDAADPDHNCDCNAQCTNTDGSFTCSCNTGYTTPFDHALRADCHDQVAAPRVKDNNNAIDWDGTTCVDEDECKMCPGLTAQLPDLNNCDAGGSTCYNTEGSFQCVCNTGLQSVDGTGTACTDYTECANSLDDIDWSTTPNSMTALCHGCTFICDGCTGDRSQGPDDAEEYVHPLGTTLEECLTACSDDDWCRAAGFEAATSTCYIQHRKGSMVMIRADAVNNRMTYLKVPEALASDADIGRVRTNLLTTGNECASTCSPNAASDYDYTCSCGANFNSLPSGECVPCGHESTYSHCEDNVCETCPVGTATAGLAACCRRDCLCKAGMVGSYNSAPAHVPEGAAVGCYSCPATFYADTPNNVCQSCPAAAAPNSIWSPKGSDDVNDCLCMVNHFYETTQDISSCPPPFGTAAAPCVQCPAGSTSQGGLGDISSCTCDSSHIRVALPNNNFRCAVRDACSMSSPCPLEGQLCRTDFTSGASKCFCDEANGYFPIQRNGMYGVHVWKLPSAACSVPALAPDDALAFSTVNALALNNNDMALLFNDIVPDNMQPAAGGSWELMAAKFNGRLKIMKGGDYHFCVQSSDGAVLRIFGSVVVSNNGRSTLAEHGKVCTYDHNIAAGDYPVEVDWFSNAGAMGLHVTYSGPDTVGYFNADGTSTQDAVNFIPLPSESSSYGDGEGGCYRQCTVRECTVVLSNHIYDEHLAVNQLHVTVDRDLEIGDSLFLPMPGWNNDDTAFTGTDINEFDFTENIIQAPRFAGLTVAPTEQTYAEIGCRVNGGELGTSPFCGASNNVVVASVSACAQQAAARGVDGFCYNRVTAGSFGGVCWITDPNTGNGIGLVDEMPTATSAQCMDDPNGDGVGQEGSGSDAFTCYRLTTPPATTQAACTFNAGDVVSGRWHRAIQTLEIEALQPVCMGTTMQLSFNGEDFGLHNPAGGFQGELAMNPEVADGCAAVVCAAPRIAAPAPVVQTVSTTETATVKAASSQSRALLAAGTFGAAAVVGSQAFGASALQTPLETDRSFASEWYSMDARGSDGVSQAQFLLPIEVELEVAAARAREYDQLQLGTGDANCNRQELRFRPYWWNEDTEQWVLLEQSSYDPATDLVRAPVPASVLNREDGKRYIVLSEHVTVSVPGCVPGSNTGGGGVPPVVPGNTPAPTSTPVSSDRDLDLAGAANDDDDDGLNGGEIAGIVLGVLAGLALLALLLLLCLKFCKPGGAAAPPPIAPPKVQTSQVVYMAKPAPVQVEYEEVEVDVFEPTVQYVPVQPQHQTVQIVEQPMPMQQQVVTRQVPQMVTRNVAAPQNVVTVMGPGPNMPMGFSGPVTEQVNMQAMAHPVPFQGVM